MSRNLGTNNLDLSQSNYGQAGTINTNDHEYNVNIHPSIWQRDLPVQNEPRTIDSVFFKRSKAVRDIINDPNTKVGRYKFYAEDHQTDSYVNTALKGLFTPTLQYRLYFSDANIMKVLKQLKYSVFKHSNGTHKIDIHAQEKTELVAVMRAMLIQYPARDPYSCNSKDIHQQIDAWNGLVVTELTPHIISNVEQRYGYLKDAGSQPIPLRHSQNVSNAGTKTLRSTTDVLFGDDFFNQNNPALFKNQSPGVVQEEGEMLMRYQ